ncbi:hypothetical protein Rt10032_c10g4297 [Rhodotorula toruloides]|uniref:Uncharacterized protein n=1 Tax=Rhodotorula toruloides TaxID=5286 RepID=A0A511KIS0_RHOTO|nr:hypothetical protein Rt10032_c10g4297 [Rhodotorula toruloides]
MLALRPLRALPVFRSSIAVAPRAYSTHPAKSGAQGSGNQGIGEDAADIQRKNAAVPMFVAAGAALIGYIAYSQMSAKKGHEQANEDRMTDMQQEKHVAGEKERMGSRG